MTTEVLCGHAHFETAKIENVSSSLENPASLPTHVGIILDGNRRWAKARGLHSAEGHRAGAAVVLDSLEWAEELGISTLTLWLLSTDNFARPEDELTELYGTIAQLVSDIACRGYPVRLLGAEAVLPLHLVNTLEGTLASNEATRLLHVNIGVGYGGRREIIDATKALLAKAEDHGESLSDVINALNEDSLTDHLYTAGQPNPDLIIRTSGEQRLSGFLLWQSVHSELVFTNVMWPDFKRKDLENALQEFASRERRFGA